MQEETPLETPWATAGAPARAGKPGEAPGEKCLERAAAAQEASARAAPAPEELRVSPRAARPKASNAGAPRIFAALRFIAGPAPTNAATRERASAIRPTVRSALAFRAANRQGNVAVHSREPARESPAVREDSRPQAPRRRRDARRAHYRPRDFRSSRLSRCCYSSRKAAPRRVD